MSSPVRVRMAPSPTGSPHVGLVRTALFNWAFARHHGGTIVLRVEDTDAARNTQESYDSILDLFDWLGFDWDEGPDRGGPHAPYRQSERGDIYRDALARLADGGHTYRCYCTTDEVAARRQAAGSKDMGYDRFCRDLTDEQVAAFEAEGRGGGRPVQDARRRDRLRRPRARTDHLPLRPRARLRARARQRRPALHAGQPGRRRADGDHPRAARRGPALQHAPPAARCTPPSPTSASARVRRSSGTCPTSWARATRSSPSATPRPTRSPTATRATRPRVCSTTWPCWAGRSRPTATSSP